MNRDMHRSHSADELKTIYISTLARGHGVVSRELQGEQAAESILEAGYWKPRTVTTGAELDALSDGSVLRDKFGDVIEKRGGKWCGYEQAPISDRIQAKYLPAAVLYEVTQ